MNKIVLPILLSLFFMACQNTPKTASESTATAPATPTAPAPAAPEAIQAVNANLSKNVTMVEDLRKQVDALPSNVRKAKAAEIEVFYAELEGMIEKQTGMLNEIKAATTPSDPKSASQDTGVPTEITPAQVQEFNESADRYAKALQSIQEAVAKMSAPQKKN